jgi:hypothetical protein
MKGEKDMVELVAVEWEYEDRLPEEMTDLDYNRAYAQSKIIDGVRVFPFVTIWNNDGKSKRMYLSE